MKILFHLGHPAHFHLFKNVIISLRDKGYQIYILIKKKDVLEKLLVENGFEYYNILPKGRKDNKFSIGIGQLTQDIKLFSFCLRKRPNILIGTSVAISHVGKVLNIPSINVNEDDADVVPLYAKLSYPWASSILAPKVCRMGKWSSKTTYYDSYHELSYLHPNNFTPQKEIAKIYVSFDRPIYVLRFAKLGAHHDEGIRGITDKIALRIINILLPYGNVYITSERELNKELDKYRINIKPSALHHVMAFANLYIGDSQTMAAECGVLGTPFIRFNDFVGRISYLDELENKYKLGFGIKTKDIEKLYSTIKSLIENKLLYKTYQERRQKMLGAKIDLTAFMVWFIESYPKSVDIMKSNPDYQYKFN
jgi:uncharacterized protein